MFAVTPYEHGWTADNYGSTWTDTGFGVNSPGHANANTKGANTNLLNGIAQDAYGIAICFSGGNTGGAVRKNLVDILVDTAAGVGNAGSSWTVKIANLLVNSASLGIGGYWYYFPLFLPAGTAIGSANQSHTASTSAMRVGVKVFGKPKHPHLYRVASGIQTIGASVPTTKGATITMQHQSKASGWTLIGTVLQNNTFFFSAGMAIDDSSRITDAYLIDIAWSPDGGTTFVSIVENMFVTDVNTEQSGKTAFGETMCLKDVPSGYDLYAKVTDITQNETNCSVVLYGAYA